ncbi:hypothetical protein FB451DRAFT_104812 [Mycena latifolia]|nr:hypothetical protein FB451DRAFT_104812 [Mycena latifolia]
MARSHSSGFDVDSTLGALLIGVLVSYVLFGVTTTQVYIYQNRFPKDSRKMKVLVAFVWFGELAHVICIGHALYRMVISDFSHPERLVNIPQSLGVSSLFNAIVTSCVQGFFSFRIYRLTKSLYIPFVTGTLSLLSFLSTVVVFVIGLQTFPFTVFEVKWGWLFNTLWSVTVANDLMIAATLVFWLWRRRDNSHLITVASVDKIIAWTIETGVVTSAAAILTLTFFVTMQTNFYSNSFLASLNSRATLRRISTLPVPVSYPVYSINSWNNPSNIEIPDMSLPASTPISTLSRATTQK